MIGSPHFSQRCARADVTHKLAASTTIFSDDHMKNFLFITSAIALTLSTLSCSSTAVAGDCVANIEKKGSSFSSGAGGVMTSIEGPSFRQEKDAYFDYVIELRGKQNYRFIYTGDVQKIRLSAGSRSFYEGVPIARFTGTTRPLKIEIQAKGDFSVEIRDECTFGSFF
ncbi:MAG: hypothetical protein V4805_09740 [Pseudomonadota bacterium]